MDKKTVGKVKNLIRESAAKHGIDLRKVIVFGSRAREDYRERSDIDLVITSPDFRGSPGTRGRDLSTKDGITTNFPYPSLSA
ncbi:hypothetical protein AKJ51_00605 [candidate division MSBL1 archaeon SCGC-AAA382A20]|uniref:Polymerase nucleotidyl transferase domain-containing protein n=1 Tax=candidate division MSBL1 archaeon SCGC-AAA382A20 TaxID=1698280 RepID=A0A133VML6_9EURY|nr:hypothetical protein AKJ51_00605 [candidate division MSBL1 archaeon SCGC-AAA382A20]